MINQEIDSKCIYIGKEVKLSLFVDMIIYIGNSKNATTKPLETIIYIKVVDYDQYTNNDIWKGEF